MYFKRTGTVQIAVYYKIYETNIDFFIKLLTSKTNHIAVLYLMDDNYLVLSIIINYHLICRNN